MNPLDLYSIIEHHLDFSQEIGELYSFYKTFCEKKGITSLIDIGCGQGEFLLSLPSSISTFGIDLSAEQIKVSQAKGLNTKAIDIADVDTTYDMATAVFDVLNYLDTPSLKLFIENSAKVLKKDGYFLFDINTLYGFEDIAQGALNIDLQDEFIAIDAIFEDAKLFTTINYFKNIKDSYIREKNTITQYYHPKDRIKKLLSKSGFKIESIIDFHLHDEQIADKYIFIAKKI